MFYAFETNPDNDWMDDTVFEIDMRLTAGIIHQVDVLFQDACDHLQHVQIFQAGFQLWPSNRGADLRGNATVISFREFYELAPGGSVLTCRYWSVGASSWSDVIIQVGLLPKRIIQPMSFDELLGAAAGIE